MPSRSGRFVPRWFIVMASVTTLFGLTSWVQPANPFEQHVTPLDIGSVMPAIALVDQRRTQFSFSTLRGRTAVVGFIYTRCTDVCPIITQKFGALDKLLSPTQFALVELTIDPTNDTPSTIAAYAKKNGVTSQRWHIATGKPGEISTFERSAGVSVIDNGKGELVHNSKLLIVDPQGRLANVDDQVAWDPQSVAAAAEHVAGDSGSWFGRLDFALTSAVAQLCGGSYRTASGILDIAATLLLLGAGLFVLGWMRGRIFSH